MSKLAWSESWSDVKFESQTLSQKRAKCRHHRQCWHYRRDRPSWHYLGVPGTIRKWIWFKIGPSWHYPRVDLGQNLAKLALSKGGSGQNWARQAQSYMLALSKDGFGPNLGQAGTIQRWIWVKIEQSWHYPRVDLAQNWARRALSHMLALSKVGVGPKVVNPRNYRNFQGWIWAKIPRELQRLQRKFKHR